MATSPYSKGVPSIPTSVRGYSERHRTGLVLTVLTDHSGTSIGLAVVLLTDHALTLARASDWTGALRYIPPEVFPKNL